MRPIDLPACYGKRFCTVVAASLVLILFTSCNKSATNEPPPATPSTAGSNVRSSADVVKVSAAGVSLSAGGNADATVTISITAGYHVNANPATFSYLIPTELTPQKIEGVIAGIPAYPSSEKKKFQFADEPLAVYEGEAQIRLPLRAESGAPKNTHSLPITLRVQACDNEKCFPPATLNSTIAVEVK